MKLETISNNKKFSLLSSNQFNQVKGGERTEGGQRLIETITHYDQNKHIEGYTRKYRSWAYDDNGCYYGVQFFGSYDPVC